MKNFNEFLKKQLENPEIAKEYRRVDPFFQLSKEMIKLRIKRGVTQKELALRIGSTQAVISRIESGSVNCSIGTIQKIAEALDSKMLIQIEPNEIIPLLNEFVIEPTSSLLVNTFEHESNEDRRGRCESLMQNEKKPTQFEWKLVTDIQNNAHIVDPRLS